MARAFGSILPRITTYDEFIGFWLCIEWDRADRVACVSDGVEIGSGRAMMPDAWIDMLCDTEEERVRWRQKEFRKVL